MEVGRRVAVARVLQERSRKRVVLHPALRRGLLGPPAPLGPPVLWWGPPPHHPGGLIPPPETSWVSWSWWTGGQVDRWSGGKVERWSGGQVDRWKGGQKKRRY